MARAHLKLKRQVWFVRQVIPPELRPHLNGRTEMLRTTGTRDVREAERLKHAILAEMERTLSLARRRLRSSPVVPVSPLIEVAREAASRNDQGAFDATIEKRLENLAKVRGIDHDTGEPLATDDEAAELREAQTVFTKPTSLTIMEALEKHLAEFAQTVRNQTVQDRRRHVSELVEWLKGDRLPAFVTGKVAGRYWTENVMPAGQAAKTVKSKLTDLTQLWVWMKARHLVSLNPWPEMRDTIRTSTRGKPSPRRAWLPEEILRLLRSISPGDPLLPVVSIAAYTGMRREEICTLKAEQCRGGIIRIIEGKTNAAVRTVPVHDTLLPLVAHLVSVSPDGWLIPGLLTGGQDQKRGHLLGTRFSQLIRERLRIEDKRLVFHSFRNTLIDAGREAGIPESTLRLIVGHDTPASITYGDARGGYSTGLQIETMRKELNRITYGGELDGFVRSLTDAATVTMMGQRRAPARSHRRAINSGT